MRVAGRQVDRPAEEAEPVFGLREQVSPAPKTASAPTTAPQRLVVPPITSIASVMNVRSR